MIAVAAVLLVASLGYMLVRLVGVRTEWPECIALGWLTGSAATTFVLFWAGIWGWGALWYLLLVAAVAWGLRKSLLDALPSARQDPSAPLDVSVTVAKLLSLLWLLVAAQFLYGATLATSLYTQYWDAYHFWHLKARFFMEEGSLGLTGDPAWMLGGAKPHYPLHLPLLKAFLCRLAGGWSDAWALGADLLNLAAFVVIAYRFLSRLVGRQTATVAVYLITSVPFVAVHLSAGFADLTVAVYLATSVLCWERWRREGAVGWLALAAFLIASAAWTKNDAMMLYVPVMLVATFMAGRWRALKPFAVGLFLPLLPWMLFKQWMGFAYAPNEGDALLMFHPLSLLLLPHSFFAYGGYGIFWFLLVALLFAGSDRVPNPLWTIGWACLAVSVAVFVFTPAAEFLWNNMTFQRSLLQVFPLLASGAAVRFSRLAQGR